MSLPPRVLCRIGCGDYGDPELEFLCGDCHGDKIEIQRQRELHEYVRSKKVKPRDASRNSGTASADSGSPTRRGPPSIDHRRALDEFMARPREKDPKVVIRECMFLERENAIRETSKAQIRKYMIATDLDEPVDPKEWGRYQYGAPRDIPRNDVDQATELAAQMKLYCNWRRRTVTRRIATRRQLLDEERKAQGKPVKRKSTSFALPKLSVSMTQSARSMKATVSARVLAITKHEPNPTDAAPEAPSGS